VLRLAAASAWNRRLSLTLAVAAVALATALMLTTERLREGLRAGFAQALSGTDLIVAARSHPIQILLATVFHVGSPAQNISRSAVEGLAALTPVAWVVPIALGDSFRGQPVIATSSAFFRHVRTGDRRALEFAQGEAFADGLPASGPHPVVLGAGVAKRFGLSIGDRLVLAHGSGPIAGNDHDDQPFRVVGLLAPTGTPIDRALLINLEAHHALHSDWVGGVPPGRSAGRSAGSRGSASSSSSSGPDSTQRAAIATLPASLSAALVGLHQRGAVFSVQRTLESPRPEPLSAVLPGVALDELWRVVGQGERLLRLTGLLVAVAALAGLVGVLLAGLDSRRRELAILRSLGAGPRALISLVIWEAALIAAAGILIGVLTSALALLSLAPWLRASYGIELAGIGFSGTDLLLLAGIQVCAMIVAAVPAWRALRLSLADGLAPPH